MKVAQDNSLKAVEKKRGRGMRKRESKRGS
jgi:hypothetical protein